VQGISSGKRCSIRSQTYIWWLSYSI